MTHIFDTQQELILIVKEFLLESGIEFAHHKKITLNTSLQHLGIDSFGRAELFQRIDKKFDIQLPDNLLAEAETLNDIVKAIHSALPAHKIKRLEPKPSNLEKSLINPAQASTLIDVLLLYATGDPNRPHIYLQDEQGNEETITYGKLFENSLRVANALLKHGLQSGETVAIMQPTNPGFFYTFFGTLLANCIPVPIYPPFRPHQIESYVKQEAKILQNAQVRILVTFHEAKHLSKLVRAFIPSLKYVTTVNSLLKEEEKAPIVRATADDFALIQYTSGSTSAPKGVLLTHQNLLTNVRAYGEAIQVTSQDVVVNWTPLYHDFGLIGMWLDSLYHGIPLILMSPLTFLNRPERWLWAIHYHRGSISGGPNFAYELCIRKIDPSMIEGLDLSSWRVAVNAAEAIQPKTLKRFTEKFAPYGFKSETLLPVYGLAESTVCVATSPLNRPPRIDRIERKPFEEYAQAISTQDEREQNSLEFVACGKPIPGHAVRIVDEANHELPDRHIGLLQFKGPSSMQGYYGNPDATSAIYHDGWWDTGDLAYLADGEIFITGRKKDLIIIAGRNLYPAEVEELTAQVPSIRKGCVIAFGISDAKRGTEDLIVVAETRDKKVKHPERIIEQVTEKIVTALDIAPDQVILVPPHTIPKTSSGKLQRAACKTAYLSGKLTKFHTPFWLQLTKIGIGVGWIKFLKLLETIGRFIYTCYIGSLFSISFLFIYASLWILPQRIVAYLCKYWARGLFFLGFCPIKILGKQHLTQYQPAVFVANHASYVDVLLLLGILPVGIRFIAKQELENFFITRHFMTKLNYITVDRANAPKGLEDTRQIEQELHQGQSIAIFPEGTFNYAAGLRPFRLGAFKIASETKTPICPISINSTRHIFRENVLLLKPSHIRVTVSKPILPNGKEWGDITNLKNQTRKQIAKDCGEPSLDLITTEIDKNRN